jgi:hypothetical protein
MTGIGFNSGSDLALVTYGFSMPITDTFDTINEFGGVGNGTDVLNLVPTTILDGTQFSIFWETGATSNVVGLRANSLCLMSRFLPLSRFLPVCRRWLVAWRCWDLCVARRPKHLRSEVMT